jgi:hypothetical protein
MITETKVKAQWHRNQNDIVIIFSYINFRIRLTDLLGVMSGFRSRFDGV